MSANYGQKLDKQTAWAVAIVAIVIAVAVWLLQAWFMMLICGALWLNTGWLAPIGYGTSLLLIFGLNVAGGIWRFAFGRRAT